MTKQEINEVATLSSGTIGNILNTNRYEDIDNFVSWLYKPMIGDIFWGELAAFGENVLIALGHAVTVYKRHYLSKSKIYF